MLTLDFLKFLEKDAGGSNRIVRWLPWFPLPSRRWQVGLTAEVPRVVEQVKISLNFKFRVREVILAQLALNFSPFLLRFVHV